MSCTSLPSGGTYARWPLDFSCDWTLKKCTSMLTRSWYLHTQSAAGWTPHNYNSQHGPYARSNDSLPIANGTIMAYRLTLLYQYVSAIVPSTSLSVLHSYDPSCVTPNSITETNQQLYSDFLWPSDAQDLSVLESRIAIALEVFSCSREPLHVLRWFLDGAVLLEVRHLRLDAGEAVGKIAILQLQDLRVDPVEQTRHHALVAPLHLVHLLQATNHLTTSASTWKTAVQRRCHPTESITLLLKITRNKTLIFLHCHLSKLHVTKRSSIIVNIYASVQSTLGGEGSETTVRFYF